MNQIKYSVEDLQKLGAITCEADSMVNAIKESTDDGDTLRTFFACIGGGLGYEIENIAFEEPLKNMPIHCVDERAWVKHIAEWRMLIQK
jgi:hypothetical protein